MQKRILTIQDYSCVGRCSLTVALPTISACGIECVGIPTAVLSNHTKFKSWTFLDLTEELEKIVGKWEDYDHSFNAIYTGYLSTSQIPIVKGIIEKLKEDKTLVFIDPAMADNGVLYAGFKPEHVNEMKTLFSVADFVKPNVTEACLMTGETYPGNKLCPMSFYEKLVFDLRKTGAKNIVLTGLKVNPGKIGILVLEEGKEATSYIEFDYLDVYFHGTGDLFSSALISLLTLGKSIQESCVIAHKYVVDSMQATLDDKRDGELYGPSFEKAIPYLLEAIK